MFPSFSRRFLCVALIPVFWWMGLCVPAARAREVRVGEPRELIICVDGVGFATIEKMREEGRFRLFHDPSRMIAPFPTLTNVAMTEILQTAGAAESSGYEDNFFDPRSNRMRGGLLERFNGNSFIKGTFRELFDYHPSAIKSGLGYALPPLSTYLEALSDLARLKQKFRASTEPVFFAYTGATDSLAHLGGERMLRSLMAQLDDTVRDIVRESDSPVRVYIFSDHGNDFRKYRRVSLKAALRRAGFRTEKRLRDERSVVLPQFGLIGCALLYTREENLTRLAEITSKVRGVNFASYEQAGIVHLISHDGAATIERLGDRFRYRTSAGDPLKLNQVIHELVNRGKADDMGYIADEDWFEATKRLDCPDAVRRVYDGVTDHVSHRANVILNFEDGYYSGSYALDIFAFLQATHGNLMRGQSLGFVMTTDRALPEYLRAEDVWQAIGTPLISRTALRMEK